MTATLLELRNIDLRDMSGGLRMLADRIDAGTVDCDTVVVVLGAVGSNIALHSFGLHASSLEVQGWLTEAQITLYNLAKYANAPQGAA